MANKENNQSKDALDMVWQNTKPGVEVTAALLSPIAKNFAETGLIFLRTSQTYRKVMSHLL